MLIGPVGLILVGILYLLKPDVFRSGLWKRPTASQSMMLPNQNLMFMRLLGSICLIAGIVLLLRLHH
jgi:uncharacterized protein YjeT (DUF2065 family)